MKSQTKLVAAVLLSFFCLNFTFAKEDNSPPTSAESNLAHQEEWLVEYYLHKYMSLGATDDIQIYDFLQQLVSRTLSYADLEDTQKIFFLVSNSSQFNAFANSRMLSLNLGLLLYLETLEELVGVIAHEVAHMKLNHSVQIFRELENTNRAIPFGLMLAGAINPLFLLGSIAYTQNSQENLAQLSRRLESEADSLGLSLYLRTGLKQQGYVRLLKQLVNGADKKKTLKYLNTHPFPIERLEHINQLIFRQDLQQSPTNTVFPPKSKALYTWYKAMVREEFVPRTPSSRSELENSPQSLEVFLQARNWLAQDNTAQAREALLLMKNLLDAEEFLLPVVYLEARILLAEKDYKQLDQFLEQHKSFITPAPLVYLQALSSLAQNKATEALELLEQLDSGYSGLFLPVKKNLCRAYNKASMMFEAYMCLVDLLWFQGKYKQAQENLRVAEKFASQAWQKKQLESKIQKNAFFVSQQ